MYMKFFRAAAPAVVACASAAVVFACGTAWAGAASSGVEVEAYELPKDSLGRTFEDGKGRAYETMDSGKDSTIVTPDGKVWQKFDTPGGPVIYGPDGQAYEGFKDKDGITVKGRGKPPVYIRKN